jgi:hypothetical protein
LHYSFYLFQQKGILSHINQFSLTPVPTNIPQFLTAYSDEKNESLFKLQQTLSNAWQHHLASSTSALLDQQSTARARACSQRYANIWLTCLPTSPELRMSDYVFRTAVCLRLNIPPIFVHPAAKSKLMCADCNVSLIDDPFHRIHCHYESSRGRRLQHDHVVSRVVAFTRVCGHHGDREPTTFRDAVSNEHPDGYINWANGDHTLFDVRGFDPLAPSYIGKETQVVSDSVAALKSNKYKETGKERYPDMKFKPFIFDTLGGLSPSAVALLRKLAKTGPVSSVVDYGPYFRHALATISVSIQVDNAAIIRSSFACARP